jgi:hypothetical protein
MRKARKLGPEHVAGLLRERASAKAEKEAEYADNRRARDEAREAYKRANPERFPATPPPSPYERPAPPPGGYTYGPSIDWDL